MGIPTASIDALLNVIGKGPDNIPLSFAIDRQPLSDVYGKNVRAPFGFEGNIIPDMFQFRQTHVWQLFLRFYRRIRCQVVG